MDVHVYEVLLQFNQGLNQAVTSLDILEKLALESPSRISKIHANLSELRSYANNHFASKIAQKEQEEENNFYRNRRNREKAEEGPNEIYLELKSREDLRHRQGLPPRAVIVPWTQADDDRILAMQKAASSSLPTQAEQSRIIGDSERENQRGGRQGRELPPSASSRIFAAGKSVFGMSETIVGASAIKPVFEWPAIGWLHLALLGEVNGRFVDIRQDNGQSVPSIGTLYTDATAPGLANQPGFVQLGEGVRIKPTVGNFELNYLAKCQQFFAPSDSHNSFLRWTIDLNHTYYLYGHSSSAAQNAATVGPDSCAGDSCPPIPHTRNLSGAIGVRLLLSESIVSATSAVPFYFQQTLGGQDIDSALALGSYQDYRFRAPNLLLLQQTFEHSIWGPFGLKLEADEGQVALKRSDFGVSVLRSVSRPVRLSPESTYRLVGAHWYAEGLYVKEQKNGSEIQAKTLFKVKKGDFVYNRLFAWKGSFAVATTDVDGCFVSNEFPCFAPLDTVDSRFLWFYFSRSSAWSEALGLSSGSTPTSRNRLKEEQFLNMEVRLPPIDEQRRIVLRIADVAAKIKEGQKLREESLGASSTLITSLHVSLSGQRTRSLGDILTLDERRVPIRPDGTYPQVGIRGFGRGLFARGSLSGTETTYREFNLLFDGALVLSQVKGWEGAIAVCREQFAGWYASPEYRTFSFIRDEALPEYMSAIVPSPWFYTKLADLTRGVGARRERTRPEAFLEMKIPMPTVEHQRSALQVFEKMDALKKIQSETSAELDALMPSILSKVFRGEL